MPSNSELLAGTAAVGVAAAIYYLLNTKKSKVIKSVEETEPIVLKEPSPEEPATQVPEPEPEPVVEAGDTQVKEEQSDTETKQPEIESIGEVNDTNPALITSLSQLEREDSLPGAVGDEASEAASNEDTNGSNGVSLIIINPADVEAEK